MKVADCLPPRRMPNGRPLYRVAPPPDGGGYDVLLSIDPVITGLAEAESICLAPAEENATHGPERLGGEYFGKADCARVAQHDGPHAYLSPEGHLMTFTRCACQDPGSYVLGAFGDGVCWHLPDFPCTVLLTVYDTYALTGNPWERELDQ